MIFDNYKHLCTFLGLEDKAKLGGKSKRLQIKEFKRFFDFEKLNNSFKLIITDIYQIPLEKVDGRKNNKGGNNKGKFKSNHILTIKERQEEFDGYYVYRHILNNEVIFKI